MPKLALLNQSGENVGEIALAESVFAIEPNQQVLYDVIKAQRAAKRQGTQKAKTRAEVRGGGRKPWRQKGTGRARQGSTRSPQWTGGGVVFAPTPRDYSYRVNRKVRRLALRSALTLKVNENKFVVLDKILIETPKTKTMIEVLNTLSIQGKIMIVLPEMNETIALAARNIPGVLVTTVEQASVYDIMNARSILTTQDAVKKYEEVLG